MDTLVLDDCYKTKLFENKTSIILRSELRDKTDFTFFTYNQSFENVSPANLRSRLVLFEGRISLLVYYSNKMYKARVKIFFIIIVLLPKVIDFVNLMF